MQIDQVNEERNVSNRLFLGYDIEYIINAVMQKKSNILNVISYGKLMPDLKMCNKETFFLTTYRDKI